MSAKQFEFVITNGLAVNAVASRLKASKRFIEDARKTLRRSYYDSFDWRLYADGGVLEAESGDDGARLNWRSLNSRDLYGNLSIAQPPHFAWDLPPGPLRTRLAPVLEMRTLLPQVEVRSQIHTLRLLNKDQKTVLRVVIEKNSVLAPTRKQPLGLGERVRVLPVKGYDKPLHHVLKVLEDALGLAPAQDDLMLTALAALERQPGDYSSKLNLQLDPALRADAATKSILLHLLDAIEANEAGTRTDLDSEFLHDFRVAIRRTRSALSQIKGVFPQRVLERFQPEFAWLGQVTGPTRDMDVYLLKFAEYRASLPASLQDALEPLHRFLRAHQKTEQQALAKALDSARYRKLKDWRAFLESPVPKRSSLPNATRPTIEVASERIWRVYRRVLKEGQAIGPQTPAEALHELRKTCKKLRYLMEFFQGLYPATHLRKLIKALKMFQENLGDFQDFEVQVVTLKRFSQQMMEEGEVPAETLMAMGILIEGLGKRQHRAREAFAARFTKFALAENRRLFKALFASPPHETLAP